MIITALPDYYAVHVDKSTPTIQVTEHSIIAWDVQVDQFNLATTKVPTPITIHGAVGVDYISHPSGIYTEVATGVQYKNREWFIQVLQAQRNEELAKPPVLVEQEEPAEPVDPVEIIEENV